jgi:methionyl aminopeptidase
VRRSCPASRRGARRDRGGRHPQRRRDADFLGYGHPPYPATLCISVNEEVVHGIPGGRVIAAGDVVSVDGGAVVAGWHGDSAFTAIVPGGPPAPADDGARRRHEEALWRGSARWSPATA